MAWRGTWGPMLRQAPGAGSRFSRYVSRRGRPASGDWPGPRFPRRRRAIQAKSLGAKVATYGVEVQGMAPTMLKGLRRAMVTINPSFQLITMPPPPPENRYEL